MSGHGMARRALGGVAVPLLFMVVGPGAPARAQEVEAGTESNVSEDVRDLIVHVRAYKDGLDFHEEGAGIVVGLDDRFVYLATARHVVALVEDPSILADSLFVELHRSRGRFLPATIDTVSQEVDLALIRVDRSVAEDAGFRPVPDRLGDGDLLAADSEVIPVGCPGGVCWSAPSPADRVLSANALAIMFQTEFVRGGSSGGGLFDEWGELVGMVVGEEPPGAEALPMDFVVERIADWGRPVSIARPSIPRRGYVTHVGVTVMSPTSGGGVPSGRAPSGRATLSVSMSRLVHANVGVLRLAPETVGNSCPSSPSEQDLVTVIAFRDRAPCEAVVNAFVAGLGLRVHAGRLVLAPFAELGMGRVRGRYDIGGSYDYDTLEYTPSFRAEEQTGFGVGLGATIDFVVYPRTIVRAVMGHWRFQDPFESAALPANYKPDMPAVYFGLGLRMGL